MSRSRRVGRRPDSWPSEHHRARSLAAERLDVALDAAEAAWLADHLAACGACRMTAAGFESDRLALRTLRDAMPQPPRDLWARTAAAIEREATGRGRAGRRSSRRAFRRIPVGALSGVLVVAVVVGASVASGRWFAPSGADGEQAPTSAASEVTGAGASPSLAVATPIAVTAGSVKWLRVTPGGNLAYNRVDVDVVCPAGEEPSCAALDDRTTRELGLRNSPRSVIGSPDDLQAVVVASDDGGSDEVIVVVLPTEPPSPRPTQSASSTETATIEPTATADPTDALSSEPSEPASTTPTGQPSDEPTVEPSASLVTPSAEPTASTAPSASAEPTEPIDPSSSPSPSLSPEPTVALELAIASGVTVVGDSAAFSPDGDWFAFTARPADGSGGPDVHVWRVGEPAATQLTTDGESVFASWDGSRVIASRPGDVVDGEAAPTSVWIEPATGEIAKTTADVWRPVVDPSGRYAVAWDGTVRTDEVTGVAFPASGALILTSWSVDGPGTDRTPIDLGDADLLNVDVRWDETGSWLAIWSGEGDDPTIGRVSLFRIDPDTGTLTQPDGAPADVPALPGFSIGDGRLAWVTPAGQDAQGSRVQVVAWTGDDVGTASSVPGEGVLVIR